MCRCIAPSQHSSDSNGPLIRCVGRTKGCNDGCLNIFVTSLLAIFMSPILLFQYCQSRCARQNLPNVRSNTCWQLCACCGPSKTNYSDVVKEYCVKVNGHRSHERNKVTFVCLSDTHNRHHDLITPLPLSDVLVHTGDFTNFGTYQEVEDFVRWFGNQPHLVKIVVPGNHDMILDSKYWNKYWSDWSDEYYDDVKIKELFVHHGIHLLIDERLDIPVPILHPFLPTNIRHPINLTNLSKYHDDVEEEDQENDNNHTDTSNIDNSNIINTSLSVYGSPWVTKYATWSTAFNLIPKEMKKHWQKTYQKIINDTKSNGHLDVLLTHMPPANVGDMEPNGHVSGCPYLREMVATIAPTVHVFGHVHSDAGWGTINGMNESVGKETQCLNAASVCDYYFLRKDPVMFEVSSTKEKRR